LRCAAPTRSSRPAGRPILRASRVASSSRRRARPWSSRSTRSRENRPVPPVTPAVVRRPPRRMPAAGAPQLEPDTSGGRGRPSTGGRGSEKHGPGAGVSGMAATAGAGIPRGARRARARTAKAGT
jgi:hypothetical protein